MKKDPTMVVDTAAARRPPVFNALFFKRYSTLIVLCLLFAAFAIGVDRFLTVRNVVNIVQQISILTIVGVGLTFCFAAREIDLSVGFAASLGGLLVPLLLTKGVPIPVAILAGLGAGLVIGLVNAAIVTLVGVPSLIATLATGSILYGLNFMISGGRAIYGGIPDGFLMLGQAQIGIFPLISIIMLAIVVLAWFLMEKSFLGRYLYAVGGNTRAAELAGISARRYRAIGLVLCSVLGVVAGFLLAARLGSGQPNSGERYLLDGLATVFIGMTMFRPGSATVIGTLFGALFIGIVNNGLNLMGLDTFVQDVLKGVIIILAVSVISRQTTLKLL